MGIATASRPPRTINPVADVLEMARRLYEISNDLEDMEQRLKVISEVCDWDSYLYNAYEDLNKIHSKLLGFMDDLKEEVR